MLYGWRIRSTATAIPATTIPGNASRDWRLAERTGPGRDRLRDLPLWVAGPWQLQLGLLSDDFTRLQLRADMTLSP